MEDNLKTGDLLLFSESGHGFMHMLSSLIKWCTHSSYTHVAMVLKDPSFIHPSLRGTFVWESSWEGTPDPQDGKIKLGVQITPLAEILRAYKKTGRVFLRKIITDTNSFAEANLAEIHKTVYDKPYDIVPKDWIEALFQVDDKPQKTNRFWCSALVGYIYAKCGILQADTDWSILRPCDFGIEAEKLDYAGESKLESIETRIQ
jgi:cell wall-associated NlpC family hydrolase